MKDNKRFFLPTNGSSSILNDEKQRLEYGHAEASRIDRERASGDILRSHEELRNLAARLQSVREEERRALSRELHDNLGQALTAMRLDLIWIDRRVSHADDARLRKEIHMKTREFMTLIDNAISTVRRISTDLRPSILDEIGLWPALESEVSRFSSRTGIECIVQPCSSFYASRDEGICMAIFRIVQEVLTNIARHAEASVVEISCTQSDTGHTLSIVDDGRGITEAEAESPCSLGLIGIRERVRGFGGGFTIARVSAEGGTVVNVTIPSKSLQKVP